MVRRLDEGELLVLEEADRLLKEGFYGDMVAVEEQDQLAGRLLEGVVDVPRC